MKNVNRFLILCLALCVVLSVAIFAADGEETVKIKNVDTKANVSAENFAGEENFKLTYSDANDNGMYLLLVLSKPEDAGEDFDPAEDLKPEDGNILYVNQATAEGTDVVFENVYPTEILEEDTYIFLAGADTGFILLGTIVPDVEEELPPAELTVNVIGFDKKAYTSVSGQVLTVTYDAACKVFYVDGNGKVVVLVAVANGADGYDFTVPAGVEEVTVVVKGDVNGNGLVNTADTGTINRSLLLTSHPAYRALTELEKIVADVNANGAVNTADTGTINRSLLLTSHPAYQLLAW